MNLNVYAFYDSVADGVLFVATAKTDGLLVRQNMALVSKMNPNFRSDLTIYQIGEFDEANMLLTACPRRAVSWDSYKRPEETIHTNDVVAPLVKPEK